MDITKRKRKKEVKLERRTFHRFLGISKNMSEAAALCNREAQGRIF